ncbi:hypothetical protein, partial [Streptococcus anginosus]|uniref:hypothetical protein n=1 Tax=Streptococcus anginosus TaxID=1328 RepID=UPI002EDB33C4
EPHISIECGTSFGAAYQEAEYATDRYEEMIFNAAGPTFNEFHEETPNVEPQKFYDLLSASQKPIWDGCTTHTELLMVVRILSNKTQFNFPRDCFNQFTSLLREALPSDNLVPADLYRTKKLVSKLGLTVIKIDCCI